MRELWTSLTIVVFDVPRDFVEANERGHEVNGDSVVEGSLPDLDHAMALADFDGGLESECWWGDGVQFFRSL